MDLSNFWFSSEPEPFVIPNSLRFRGSQDIASSYMDSGSTWGSNWTLSFWIKMSGPFDSTRQTLVTGLRTGGGNYTMLAANEGGAGQVTTYSGATTWNQIGLKKDPTAWNHYVMNSNDQVWVNGVEQTNVPAGYWSNFDGCDQVTFGIWSTGAYFNGYLAEFYGVQKELTAFDFGEYSETGVWTPIDPGLDPNKLPYSAYVSTTLNGGYIAGRGPKNMFDGSLATETNVDNASDTLV